MMLGSMAERCVCVWRGGGGGGAHGRVVLSQYTICTTLYVYRLQVVLHLLERVSLLYQQRYWDSSVSR